MRINHVAMYVKDLDNAKHFFTTYFDATAGEMYVNPKTGFSSYFLSFDDGARLEIMCRPDMVDEDKPLYRTGYNHVAFSVGSRERVDELTARLHNDGYQIVSGPRTTGDGYYESCMVAIEWNLVEITI